MQIAILNINGIHETTVSEREQRMQPRGDLESIQILVNFDFSQTSQVSKPHGTGSHLLLNSVQHNKKIQLVTKNFKNLINQETEGYINRSRE